MVESTDFNGYGAMRDGGGILGAVSRATGDNRNEEDATNDRLMTEAMGRGDPTFTDFNGNTRDTESYSRDSRGWSPGIFDKYGMPGMALGMGVGAVTRAGALANDVYNNGLTMSEALAAQVGGPDTAYQPGAASENNDITTTDTMAGPDAYGTGTNYGGRGSETLGTGTGWAAPGGPEDGQAYADAYNGANFGGGPTAFSDSAAQTAETTAENAATANFTGNFTGSPANNATGNMAGNIAHDMFAANVGNPGEIGTVSDPYGGNMMENTSSAAMFSGNDMANGAYAGGAYGFGFGTKADGTYGSLTGAEASNNYGGGYNGSMGPGQSGGIGSFGDFSSWAGGNSAPNGGWDASGGVYGSGWGADGSWVGDGSYANDGSSIGGNEAASAAANGTWNDGSTVGSYYGSDGLNEGDSGGGGGGSGGDSWVICTELNRQGLLETELYHLTSGWSLSTLPQDTLEGYWSWARPYARLMKRSKLATSIAKPVAYGRALEIAHRIDPVKHPKSSIVGKMTIWLGEPLCSGLGKLVNCVRNEKTKSFA